MTKRFLISLFVLATGMTAWAQSPTALWGKAVQTVKTTQGCDMGLAPDGGIYTVGNAGTRTEDEFVQFGSDQLAPGTIYRGSNDLSSVQMFLLSRLSADGHPLWTVYSKDAEAMSNGLYLQPVSDGVVAFFGIRHTDKGGDYSPAFVDATGQSHDLDWRLESTEKRYYRGIVMKVSSEGAILWIRQLVPTDHSLDQSLTPNDIAADGDGNLWIGGKLTGELTLIRTDGSLATLTPNPQCEKNDALLAKLTADGYYLGRVETDGTAESIMIDKIAGSGNRLYLLGTMKSAGQITVGGKSLTGANGTESIFTAELNTTDQTLGWAQYYPSTGGGVFQWTGMTAGAGGLWLTGTTMIELTTASGKVLTSGELTRAGMVLKVDAANGDLLDGYVRAVNQSGYFAAFEDADGYLYAVAHQGTDIKAFPNAGALWIDKFDPTDLSAPIGTWDNMIGNAAGTQTVAYDESGRFYTMTRSKVIPNALMGSDMTIEQTSKEFCCNVCAFQLPVKPATGIRNVTIPGKNTIGWYNLKGQRISQPSKGIYIHNGQKTVLR